jgi:uncharacterized protein
MTAAEGWRLAPIQEQEYHLPADTHLLSSAHVAQTFKIQVAQPARRRGEKTRFPVVYATDGNRVFEMFKGISEIIQISGYDAPRFILVTIGYPSVSPRAGAMLRVRDFTFPGYPRLNPVAPDVEGVLFAEAGTKSLFGAPDFQQFIANELIGFIDDRYDTIPGDRTYFGHSGGGGFGLYTLFTRCELFRNYIVSSPGLSFHGEAAGIRYDNCEFLLQEAQRFIGTRPKLTDTTLYMSVGSEEEFEPDLAAWQLTSSFYRMSRLLATAAIPGLRLRTEVFERETHMTVWPMAFIHGVQAVFDAGMWRRQSP